MVLTTDDKIVQLSDKKVFIIGDFIEQEDNLEFDLSSTLRLRARSIDHKKLWASKDRSAEFMGDIWSLFVDSKKEERIRTVLHSVCVELIENAVKYGSQECDYRIVVDLCLKQEVLLVYVVNKCAHIQIPDLEASAKLVIGTNDIIKLFKQKMKESKEAKKNGQRKSQLGFIRILMQKVSLAWQINFEEQFAVVTTLAKIEITK